MKSIRGYINSGLALLVFALTLSPSGAMAGELPQMAGKMEAKITGGMETFHKAPPMLGLDDQRIQAVSAVLERHNQRLLDIPEVVATAVGLTETGKPAIQVFTKRAVGFGIIPENLDNVPVVVQVSGEFVALADPTVRFSRPVPIGVSSGNEGECSSGTIGARVKKGDGTTYALSNNHVYALENKAAIGSKIVQPGLYDTGCTYDADNLIGTLSAFVPIKFIGKPKANKVDAAIAACSTTSLDKMTPEDGYGMPGSSAVSASINQKVQKYGRTTRLTKGIVSAINATVKVTYDSGVASFGDQIIVKTDIPFLLPGDSGSLLVTDDSNASPVGLLFAGNSSGTFSVANRIDTVLKSFGVTIDGK